MRIFGLVSKVLLLVLLFVVVFIVTTALQIMKLPPEKKEAAIEKLKKMVDWIDFY